MNRLAFCISALAAVGLSACGSSPKASQPTMVAEPPVDLPPVEDVPPLSSSPSLTSTLQAVAASA